MTIRRMDNVGIVVDDLDDTLARLRTHGAELLGDVDRRAELPQGKLDVRLVRDVVLDHLAERQAHFALDRVAERLAGIERPIEAAAQDARVRRAVQTALARLAATQKVLGPLARGRRAHAQRKRRVGINGRKETRAVLVCELVPFPNACVRCPTYPARSRSRPRCGSARRTRRG